MLPRNPTAGIKKICSALGPEYSIKVIDKEQCIYRDLGNGFDFEVSGLNNNRQKMDATLYVWDNRKYIIVEIIPNIKSISALTDVLTSMAIKYSHLEQ